MPVDIYLKQKLDDIDAQYGGEEMFRIFGPTMLSWATTDSSRMYMFTSHIKQALTLLEPDVPHLQTGFENSVGKRNNAYKQLEGTWEVLNIIKKFSHISDPKNQIVMLVLYNKKTNTVDMIEKPIAEDLTEKFGYVYNTDFIDSLTQGDKLKDPVIYKSTAYDDQMNYRYGKNARIYYSTSTDTIEEAIVKRKGRANNVLSVEVDTVSVPVNDNDVLLNIYGDDDNYIPFPHVGNMVKNSLICATRRINRNHLLYDFQKEHMRELTDTDTDYYVSKNSIISDVNVYYNGDEEFPDNLFYRQLKLYYDNNCRYAQEIMDIIKSMKEAGYNYTQNVSYYSARYMHYNDKTYKWVNKDKAFSHIILEFTVKSVVSLEPGSKLTARFGNKGVVSRITDTLSSAVKNDIVGMIDDGSLTQEELNNLRSNINIVDDERMPYYINPFGERVYADLIINSSGAIRRLNPGQLTEVETNFIAEQVRYKIIQAKTREEKIDIIFKFLDTICKQEGTFFRNLYDSFNTTKIINGMNVRLMAPESMDDFIRNIEKYGFYLVRPPHKPILFDDVIRLYEAFPDVKPVDIYVDIFGTKQRKMIKKGIIGYEYMMVLKQNSNKNFSARSTFRVNRSNLPAKDIAKKTNRSSYARTPIRLSEIYNLLASISGEDLAEYNIFMRSSALGRKSLDRILISDGNPLKIKKLKVKDNYTNANADILAARLKAMGLRINFSALAEGRTEIYDKNTVYPLHFGEYTIYDIPSMRGTYAKLFDQFKKELNSLILIESYRGERHDVAWDNTFEALKDVVEISDDTKGLLKACTKGHQLTLLQNFNSRYIKSNTSSEPSNTAPRKRGRKPKIVTSNDNTTEEAHSTSDENESEIDHVDNGLESEDDILFVSIDEEEEIIETEEI
jgi:hypothetical protein